MSSDRIKRMSITMIFFIHGLLFGNWVTRIPGVKQRLELSEGELGILLFAISIGLMVTINFTGGLIDKFSSKQVTGWSTIIQTLILPLLAIAPTYLTMWLTLFVYGSAMTVMNIAMNAQGVEIENNHLKYPVMSSLHAAYSIGGFTGATYGGLLITLGINSIDHFLSVVLLVIPLVFIFHRNLVLDVKEEIDEDVPLFKFPPKALWPLGIIGLLSSVGEGTLTDWTGVFIIESLGVGEARAAWGFATFSLSMTVGRLLGDKVIEKFSKPWILRFSGILGFSGIILTVLSSTYVITLIGIAISGFGMSVIVPIVFSTAGKFPGIQSGAGIAGVVSIGYLGFLLGPPTIGFIADFTSLSVSFSLIAILLIGVIFLANYSKIPET